ncbi:MAG: UvrD-helicase domain-containing protein [Ignavibacteriales bacterium]|nr:UvrD-helicase domain-containing protein [Ignavibacteriales bacterium]
MSKKLYEENIFLVENINTKFEDIIKIEIPDNYIELNDDLAKFSKTITDFYKQVEERYKFKKQQKSFLDFEDLLLITYKLLQNEEVADLLSKKYKYVMVDEYQDTNEIQYQIFMPILQFLACGNLFVVGDDKQSIYMFHEAEVKVFNDTKKQIEDIEGSSSLLQLPHSFRLAPNIALFTNKLFSRLFENPNPSFNEVEYNELVCAYPKDNKGKIEFIIFLR